MKNLIEKAAQTHCLSKEELLRLLENPDCNEALFAAADEVRRQYVGDEIHLRGLIEFSNYCRNNCRYCGLRRDNKNLKRYRLDEETIVKLATHGANMGLKTIVLQSGEDVWYSLKKMVQLIEKIKKLGAALTLSVGEKSAEEYMAYKNAGADRFLLRIETTDKRLYEENDPGMSWEKRVECLRNIWQAGLETGSGCLVGLPGQSLVSLAEDILFFKQIKADMIGIGPLIPHPDTPLKNCAPGNLETALKVMALTRLLLPDINIPATTAMETLAPDGQIRALQSGANVIMPNVTLTEYRRYYEIYPGKSTTGYSPDESLQQIKEKVYSIGRKIGSGYGGHRRT